MLIDDEVVDAAASAMEASIVTAATGAPAPVPTPTGATAPRQPTTAPSVATPSVATPSGIASAATTSPGTETTNVSSVSHSTAATSQPPQTSGVITAGGSNNKNVSGGAAAGIAIACLIAGALIALLVLFLLGKFGRKKRGTGSSLGGYANEKGPSVGVREVGFSDASFVESNLPQPVEDNAVITEVGVLRDRISGHVKSYYDLSTPGLTAAASAIDALGLRVPTPRLLALLADPNSRAAALQYLISATIISRCELGSDPNESFLPFEIAVSLQKMQKSNLDPKGAYTISIPDLYCGEQVLL